MSARRRAKVVPLPTRPVVGCGHGAGCPIERLNKVGIKLTLAEAIRDLSALHDSRSEHSSASSEMSRWDLVTGILHVCLHREIEHRMDDAAQRRGRFTLVKGTEPIL
jgi:hypothetical protein